MVYCFSLRLYLVGIYVVFRFLLEGRRICIFVDSREIIFGLEVIFFLRVVYGLQVEVCFFYGCGYIVSNRMVVERRFQSEMLNSVGKNKFIDQIQYLQSMFERICVIVEKDREKIGLYFEMFLFIRLQRNLIIIQFIFLLGRGKFLNVNIWIYDVILCLYNIVMCFISYCV